MIQGHEEFERQVSVLVEKGYPNLANISHESFAKELEPLKALVNNAFPDPDFEKGTLPFVLIINSTFIPADRMMQKVEREGKNGIEKLFPQKPDDFSSIADVIIPKQLGYLIIDIDRGKETINITPELALQKIKAAKRSPLTIDEGIAIVTQFPDFLKKNNCFSLLASRIQGNQRVPAIWINGKKHPNLGWCWDRNPHTWLGSASCKERVGIN